MVDGDTLRICAERIRLEGIDAPERDQLCARPDGQRWPCGAEAAENMRQLIAGKAIRCEVSGLDRCGRSLATCFDGAVDLKREQVLDGFALAYRHYSLRYVDDEAAARTAEVNMWSGTFVEPWTYRHGH